MERVIIKPKYIQINCKEEERADLRQAEAVLKFKPDIIFLEYPNSNKTPNTIFNKYKPYSKPLDLLKKQRRSLEESQKIMPWIKSDIVMWENLGKLWKQGHQVLVFNVDASSKLTNELYRDWKKMYPRVKKNWLWWVKIYLRERIMANNIQWALKNYKEKTNPTILVFLQSFHWNHVKFLLKNPSKDKIWDYYFGKFSEVNRVNIEGKIKELNKVFYKYWIRFADF